MCDRQVYACHDMCGGQIATLNVGLYLPPAFSYCSNYKTAGTQASRDSPISPWEHQYEEVHYCTGVLWLSRSQLLIFAWQARYPLSRLPSPGNAYEA